MPRLRFALCLLIAAVALPLVLPAPVAAADRGATTVFVLDVSGSMDSPGAIPAGFPDAAKLKATQDQVERFIEQAKPGHKVTLQVIVGAASSIKDWISLQQELADWMKARHQDPDKISKLYDLKVAATALLQALRAERLAGATERVGLVTFSDDANVLASTSTSLDAEKNLIDGLRTDGATNMGSGLQDALDMLDGQVNPAVVLLTDGWNNTGMTDDQVLAGPVAKAAASHTPICTIGIGQSPLDVDQTLLWQIAQRTSAGYYFVGDGLESLQPDLLACHASSTRNLVGDLRGSVAAGATSQAGGFSVGAGTHTLAVNLSSPAGRLGLRVTDPSGSQIGSGYPGAHLVTNSGLTALSLSSPPPGRYAVAVLGISTGPSTQPYAVTASTDGRTATKHLDQVKSASAADQTDLTLERLRLTTLIGGGLLGLMVLLAVAMHFIAGARAAAPAPIQYSQSSPGAVPAARPAGGGFGRTCLGCLYWLLFSAIAVVVAGAAIGWWLWQQPLITFPK